MKRSKNISTIMKPPIVYYGGKIRLAPWIVGVMQRYEFKRYVEVFGGSGAVLFAKQPSKNEIYNDLYSDVVNLYKVLRDPCTYQQFVRIIEHTPYSREIYHDARQALDDNETSGVQRAAAFFVCLRQSFSNLMNSWSTPSESSRTVASLTYWKSISRLPEIHERLQNVHIEHLDAVECIKKYANDNSLCYIDPPYIHATRVAPKTYKHEYTDEQHRELVETILSVPGHKILSGYESPLYKPLLDAGWTLEKKEVCCHASGLSKKTYRVECLYCSPVRCTATIRNNIMGKHPYDRKVFFVQRRNDFLSVRDVQHLCKTGNLSSFDYVFDVDGGSYIADSIMTGRSPKWAMSAVYDPMLQGLPTPSEEDMAMVDELLCQDDFIEMPKEPTVKNVKDYLASEPRVASMVYNIEHRLF